jgi:pimeloyl-ACP methyl ester carboxylesterase
LVLLITIAAVAPTNAARVTNITATHHDGQTFLTWTSPDGTGWKYRVYASTQPIWFLSSFWPAVFAGEVGDSTWCDRRLTGLTGIPHGYAIDSLATPLDSTQAVMVVTPACDRVVYYCVTAESSGRGEDRSFTISGNTLLSPVYESLAAPRPVYQRSLTVGGTEADIYTLWTTRHPTSLFPAMHNKDGVAYDCAIVRGGLAPDNSLMIRPHARGSDFLQGLMGSGWPGEWRLALDDPWLNHDGNTFWYGWHENYDVDSWWNAPPTSGVVRDYTWQRMLYTVLWARRTFPIDPTRVYAYGYSMGGIGSVQLALKRPDLIAGVMAFVGKFDFGFDADPNPASEFNRGGELRSVADRMWGQVSTNLPTSDGPGVYQLLNDGYLARELEGTGVPPIIAFSGKNDVIVGWAEKIGFYQAMREHRQGGTFFWDERTHNSNTYCSWLPLQNIKYLYRFRTNRSFPAITRCSADFNPGVGSVASGDIVGTINGFVEWDTTLVDETDRWETTLQLRNLASRSQTYQAPESLTVQMTPRRLQNFPIVRDALYAYTVTRVSDGALVQHGVEGSDSLGLLTLYWVKVYKGGGSRVHIERIQNTTGVDDALNGAGVALALSRNPVVGAAVLSLRWPVSGDARVDLLDVAGRKVRSLYRGRAVAGKTTLPFDSRGLNGGVYFLSAAQGGVEAIQRVVVLR